jgi:hypothetical protein
MGNTPNNNFPYPEPTDLVKDGAQAIEDLADAIDTTLGVYAPVSSGLTLINTTSFSGVSSQSINNCFNASYRNYRIFLDFTCSGTLDINFRLRVGGVDNSTASSYNRQNFDMDGNIGAGNRLASNQHLMGGGASTAVNMITMDVTRPFLADTTGFNIFNQRSQNNAWLMLAAGYHNQSVSYDGITLLTSANNITGQISVFGYNA